MCVSRDVFLCGYIRSIRKITFICVLCYDVFVCIFFLVVYSMSVVTSIYTYTSFDMRPPPSMYRSITSPVR